MRRRLAALAALPVIAFAGNAQSSPNDPLGELLEAVISGALPGTPVFVLMTTNGGVGYLPPRETYGTGRYQEQQSPYAAGCLEQSIAEAGDVLAGLS